METPISLRAIRLLPETVPLPPRIPVILNKALRDHGPQQLSVLSPNAVPNLETLELLEQSEDIEDESLTQNK